MHSGNFRTINFLSGQLRSTLPHFILLVAQNPQNSLSSAVNFGLGLFRSFMFFQAHQIDSYQYKSSQDILMEVICKRKKSTLLLVFFGTIFSSDLGRVGWYGQRKMKGRRWACSGRWELYPMKMNVDSSCGCLFAMLEQK